VVDATPGFRPIWRLLSEVRPARFACSGGRQWPGTMRTGRLSLLPTPMAVREWFLFWHPMPLAIFIQHLGRDVAGVAQHSRRPGLTIGTTAATSAAPAIAIVAPGGQDALGVPGPEGLAAPPADPRAIGNHRREGTVPHALPCRSARHRCLPHIQRRRRGREAVRQDGNPAVDGRPEGRPAARLRLRVAAVRDSRSARAHAGLRSGDSACQRTHTPHDQVPGGRSPHAGDPRGRRLVDMARRRRCNTSDGQGRAEDHGRCELADSAGTEEAETAQALMQGGKAVLERHRAKP
jgi:hypothetical protein